MKNNGNDQTTAPYYLGLDVGTESIGWAVTDKDYQVLRFKGNSMWGIRLFEEAKGAQDRRMARAARRRLARRKQRIQLLELMFAGAVEKEDPYFFRRLHESSLQMDDRTSTVGKYTLFNDTQFTDKQYLRKYPTIYHLRSELVHSSEPHDVRLVFLALHHLLKHRGHFLYEGNGAGGEQTLRGAMDELCAYLRNEYDAEFVPEDMEQYLICLKDRDMGITQKKRALKAAYGSFVSGEEVTVDIGVVSDMLTGASVKLSALFLDEELKKSELKSLSLADDLEEKFDVLNETLGERMGLIETMKTVFDVARLEQILGDHIYLSDAKVALYEKNYKDLRLLKQYVRQYAPEQYKQIFSERKDKLNNYAAYSRYKGKSGDYECGQEEFCAYLKKTLPKISEAEQYKEIADEIDKKGFLKRLSGTENGIVPYQMQKKELVRILENASVYLPFLNTQDADGLTVKDKIISLFEYRIPYYVGPLNPMSPNKWVVRTDEKIYPWNFEKVVDMDATAQQFIINLIGRCTYTGDYVIPRDSLLYSEYALLNEINNLRINGKELPVDVKQKMIQALFVDEKKRVTKKSIAAYLKREGLFFDGDQISGIDDTVKSLLKSYHDFKPLLEKYGDAQMVEEIIQAILIYSDDKKMLKRWLKKNFRRLNGQEVDYICRLKYKDWGRLSREFLTEIKHPDENGELHSIMDYLRSTNLNLMKLLSTDYTFRDRAEEYRRDKVGSKRTLKERLEEMYIAPAVRRSIRQTLRIVDEIVDIRKAAPEKIFIEVARGEIEELRNVRTESRKNKLLELYRKCGQESSELYERLETEEEHALRRDKLYLYYTQFGKCMYSGETIELSAMLADDTTYDIDHIFPRSRIKDDSIDNRVLVKSVLNRDKTNTYPIAENIRSKMLPFWTMLREKNLISEKKYDRLKRNHALTDKELSDFVARQLVETQQSTIALATLLNELYPASTIVYSKARNVSDFRHQFELVKCREINDTHHAKDAYLNIVVGNVYHTKFTERFFANIHKENYSVTRVFDYETPGAWTPGDTNTIATVRKYMAKNNVLFTRMPYEVRGQLYDLQIRPAGEGQLEVKNGRDIKKYGGYNKLTGSYSFVVEHTKGKKRIRSIETVYLYLKDKYESDAVAYCTEVLKLVDPVIIVKKIGMDALMEFDGLRMHISGRTGAYHVYKQANQLAMKAEVVRYIRKLFKYSERCAKARTELKITAYDGITKEENSALYDWYLTKMSGTVYGELFAKAEQVLKDGRKMFDEMSEYEQVHVLLEVLKVFKCDAQMADFTKLGGVKSTGRVLRSDVLTGFKTVRLISQSITGLYEVKQDLLR